MEAVEISNLIADIPMSEQEKEADLFSSIHKLNERMNETDVKELSNRKLWMINSTSTGGGVAEMLPRIIYTLRSYGFDVEWLIFKGNDDFFSISKRIHNFIHGQNPSNVLVEFSNKDREIFENVTANNGVTWVNSELKKGDVVMIHDPQPCGLISHIREKFTSDEVPCLWRCHIGYDSETPESIAAWNFLEKYIKQYDLTIFSAEEYIPNFAPNPKVVHPSLHPIDFKNRFLSFYDIKIILGKAGLVRINSEYLSEDELYPHKIKMLKRDNTFGVPSEDDSLEKFGFLDRPIILEISRWDRLKGWSELIQAFAELKANPNKYVDITNPKKDHELYIKRMALVLAGPDTSKVSDDPEGYEVFVSLTKLINSYPDEIRNSIAMLCLPLDCRTQNALIVNSLQSLASIVVQNSIREGFGLTLLEAMWKQKPCVASSACGLRQQLRPEIDGLMIKDALDPKSVLKTINNMIEIGDEKRQSFARNAKKRVIDNFLIYEHVTKYLNCITTLIK